MRAYKRYAIMATVTIPPRIKSNAMVASHLVARGDVGAGDEEKGERRHDHRCIEHFGSPGAAA
jgi:hypothetical protein